MKQVPLYLACPAPPSARVCPISFCRSTILPANCRSWCAAKRRDGNGNGKTTIDDRLGKLAMARILLVEDSPTQALPIRFVLQKAGFQVDLAANGVGALRVLEKSASDLVLT